MGEGGIVEHVACLTQVLRLIANEYVAHAQTNKQTAGRGKWNSWQDQRFISNNNINLIHANRFRFHFHFDGTHKNAPFNYFI